MTHTGLKKQSRFFSARISKSLRHAVPQLLAFASFSAGAILLFSGAVPAAAGRLEFIAKILPLAVVEASHFVASLVGMMLVVIARGLQRRVDAALDLALSLLAAGIVFSLAKGVDYEEAFILGGVFFALAKCRGHFYRTASLFAPSLSWRWTVSTVLVVAASIALYVFAFKRSEYSSETWWRFALNEQAPRALRATIAAAVLGGCIGIANLLRPKAAPPKPPTKAELEQAREIILRSPATHGNLALRGDKTLMFSRSAEAFLMYARHRRSWVAMGDPIGPREDVRELLWDFYELCDQFGGWPVVFEARADHSELYRELGLTLTPLGEEARVDLTKYSLEGPERRTLRHDCSKLLRLGCRFEIVPRENVGSLLPELARVSDAWLTEKTTHEKGFSNASFEPDYLCEFPIAAVRQDGKILGFANLWSGAGKQELSVDLMRHVPDAPNGTMDFLFAELLMWGKREGYQCFNFGMAPLSRPEEYHANLLWRGVATFLYRHGEHFYNFQGLRHFKAKFGPQWVPLYLASPGGIALPAILVDVTALIAGGLMGIVSKRETRPIL